MTTDGRIAVLTEALRRLERWGSCFCENSTISAETLWREFPRALKEARAALAATGTADASAVAQQDEAAALLKAFLACPEIADCAPEDRDPETADIERRARRFLASREQGREGGTGE